MRGEALLEWRVYVVHRAGRFRIVDRCRICLSTKAADGKSFVKSAALEMVEVPPEMHRLATQLCTAFKASMDASEPALLGIDFVQTRGRRSSSSSSRSSSNNNSNSNSSSSNSSSSSRFLILEVNVDDVVTQRNSGSNVGITSLRRVTRGMPDQEKKYVDRDTMLAAFDPLRRAVAV
eukprot:SAG22_NODE_1499_length_4287_cov_10.199857_1_plen_177_part_00